MKISRTVFWTLAICYVLALLIVYFAGYVFSHAYPVTNHVPFFS
jgi:hypothetical protein